MLLGLLENFSELTLGRPFTQGFGLEPDANVKALLEYLACKTSDTKAGPLTKLRRIHMEGEGDYSVKTHMQDFNAFFILPALRELRGWDFVAVDDNYMCFPFERQYQSRTSNSLEDVELVQSVTDASQLASFICKTPRLRSFKLEHTVKQDNLGDDWDSPAVISTLAQHCGTTLRDLSITTDPHWGAETSVGGLRSTREFVELEHLELDVQLFCGPPVTEKVRSMQAEEYWAHIQTVGWDAGSVPSLVDILPSSILSVRLLDDAALMQSSVLENLFKLNVHGTDSLPHLRTVTVHRDIWSHSNGGKNTEHLRRAKSVVEAAGGDYVETPSVRALWLDDILPEHP
jgi:hypothetical protein